MSQELYAGVTDDTLVGSKCAAKVLEPLKDFADVLEVLFFEFGEDENVIDV